MANEYLETRVLKVAKDEFYSRISVEFAVAMAIGDLVGNRKWTNCGIATRNRYHSNEI